MCRVSKYNPRFRNSNDNYTIDEWTSVSDVGSSYEGLIFTYDNYLDTENCHIKAIHNFLNSHKLTNLSYYGLEDYLDYEELDEKDKVLYSRFKKFSSQDLNIKQIDIVIRLVLREVIWCKLRSQTGLEIHFGYDYYMYFFSPKNEYDFSVPEGIYIEPHISSPYLLTC